MKKFLLQLSLFTFIAYLSIFFIGKLFNYIISTQDYNILNDPDLKIKKACYKSKQLKKTKKLIIGDSTGFQLYGDDNNNNVISLCTTGAVTMVGHYCLLAKFLETNQKNLPDEVILIHHPIYWNNVLSGTLAYSCFAKNFYNNDFTQYIEQDILDSISNWPYSYLCNQEWYQICPYSVVVNSKFPFGEWTSPQMWNYFNKIQALCKEYQIKFRLTSGCVRESFKTKVSDLLKSHKQHTNDSIIVQYLHNIIYMPDEQFIDDAHLKKEYIPKDLFNLY